MSRRRSYRDLLSAPAWGLYDANGELVATLRAKTATDARDTFRRHVATMPELARGQRIRRINPQAG